MPVPREVVETPEPLALLPPVTGVVGTGGASGTSLPVTGVAGKIQLGMTVTGTGIPAGTTILAQTAGTTIGGAGTYRTSQATTAAAAAALTFTAGPSLAFFPAFAPIVPPPPIGADKAIPNFPPPTPPPIGTVPIGDLVGPAVAAAAVPPSVAGIPLIRTVSAWTAKFPDFLTTFPSPPIVFTNTMMIGATKPPQTTTTQNIPIGGWGPPVGPSITPPPLTPRLAEAQIGQASLLEEPPPLPEEPPPEEPPPERNGRRRRRK